MDQARACGRAKAETLGPAEPRAWLAGAIKQHTRSLRRVIYSGVAAHPTARPYRSWLAENGRLIAATVTEIQDLAGSTHHLPVVGSDPSAPVLRVCVLADAFLDHVHSRFDEDRFVAFLQGAQEVSDLTLGEISATRPALQLALIEERRRGRPQTDLSRPLLAGAVPRHAGSSNGASVLALPRWTP